jgi:hypothetical protein
MNSSIKRIREMSLVKMFGHLVQAPLNMLKAVGGFAASVLTFAAGCVAGVLTPIFAVTLPLSVIAGFVILGACMGIVAPPLGVIGAVVGVLCGIMVMDTIAKAVWNFMSTQTGNLFDYAGRFLKEAGASFQAVFTSLQAAFRSFLDGCGTLSDFAEKNVGWVGILLAAVSIMLLLVGLNTLVIPVFMAMLAPIIIGAFASGDAGDVNQKVVVSSQREAASMLRSNSLSEKMRLHLKLLPAQSSVLKAEMVSNRSKDVLLCEPVMTTNDPRMVKTVSVVPEATVLDNDDGAVCSGMMVR